MPEAKPRLGIVHVALLGYLLAIFVGGGMRVGPQHVMSPLFSADKLLHGLVFAFFVPLLWAALAGRVAGQGARILAAVLVSSTVGGLLELYQAALPHRAAELMDLVADALGAVAAGVLLTGLTRWRTDPSGPVGDP